MTPSRPRIAIIGAGLAGAACARRLADAGADVHLFEKSRGVGGRMGSRRVRWIDDAGVDHDVSFDHGAPGFSVRSAAFAEFVHRASLSGELTRWSPTMAAGIAAPLDGFGSWIATPDMSTLCRRLVDALPVTFGRTVDVVRAAPGGWGIECLGETLGEDFTHVALAMPPLQAAKLLEPHRHDWARLGLRQRMLPCWTLVGVSDRPVDPPDWDAAWPMSGPLAWIIRNERKPGRADADGFLHWVAHAKAGWSETHLESLDDAVHSTLLAAVRDFLGQAPVWRFSQVHRWRYASVARPDAGALEPFWFDAERGLGACGDFLGGAGVEGAWISGDALATRIARGCGLTREAGLPARATTT